jgi:hypothetical protein
MQKEKQKEEKGVKDNLLIRLLNTVSAHSFAQASAPGLNSAAPPALDVRVY